MPLRGSGSLTDRLDMNNKENKTRWTDTKSLQGIWGQYVHAEQEVEPTLHLL